MSTVHSPYNVPMGLKEEEDFEQKMEASPTNSKDETPTASHDTNKQGETKDPTDNALNSIWEETENFDDAGLFPIPPSFTRLILEETLQDDCCPFVMWATLKFNIPTNQSNVEDQVYDQLANFLDYAVSEDKHFTVFPYNLSKYWHAEDLPQAITDMENLPEDMDEWLPYFPGAKPCFWGGDIYTAVLIGLSLPFPKFINKISGWCKDKGYGLWPMMTLQTEKLVSLGWLLAYMMDIKVLKASITDAINGIPVGLRWKMISLGIQGPVKQEEQVKALHIYVDKMDVAWAKPQLMEVYASRPQVDHAFLLKIRMHLVPEMDSVLNTKGWKNVDKLWVCQNMWNSTKLIYIKTWEIKLLDDQNKQLRMSLRDAMMHLCHPTNSKLLTNPVRNHVTS